MRAQGPRGRGRGDGITRGRSISQPRRGPRVSRTGRNSGLVQLQVELFENGATDNVLPQLGDRGQAAAVQPGPGEVTMLADQLTGVSIASMMMTGTGKLSLVRPEMLGTEMQWGK